MSEGDGVVERARSLRQVILSARAETESRRCLAPSVVAALVDANLHRLAVPLADGGLEAPPLEALRTFEELASVEASAAWIAWNCTLPALMGRFLDPDVRHALFVGPRTIMANSTRPSGRAVRCAGGFRVQGRWSLVSGCELADVILLRCVVAPTGGESGPPELIMAYLPRSDCRVVDTWHAGGLRGTGSHDIVVEDAFAPASRTVSFSQSPQLTSPLYRMPFAATLSAGCASICLGLGRMALEVLLDLAASKVPVDGRLPLRDQPSLLVRIARLKSQQAAARLLLHSAVEDAWHDCLANRPITLQRRAELWAAAHHAASASKDVVRQAYEAAGASALYTDCPLERAHRDLHAVTQHIILNESLLQDAGRAWLGAEPANPVFAS